MIKRTLLSTALCISFYGISPTEAHAGVDPYIGEIMMTGANFCPRGTVSLDGQLLPISQNTALFSLLGTTYGGDGRTSFGIPDMRGRSPVHAGFGPGLETVRLGQRGGAETSTPKSSGLTGTKSKDGERVASALHKTNNRGPYLVIKYCMAITGTYPSRN